MKYCVTTLHQKSWAGNSESVERAKHMDLKNYSIKHTVESVKFTVNNVLSNEIESDRFTKALYEATFEQFLGLIGVFQLH